mgnify:CR=1 FL=1
MVLIVLMRLRVDQIGGNVKNQNGLFALIAYRTQKTKEYIQKNPERYDPKKHEHLFTKEERKNLSQSMRG